MTAKLPTGRRRDAERSGAIGTTPPNLALPRAAGMATLQGVACSSSGRRRSERPRAHLRSRSREHLLRRERQPGPQTQIPLGSESPPYQCSHDYLKSATVKTALVSPQSTEEGRDIAVGSGLTPGGLERRSCLIA